MENKDKASLYLELYKSQMARFEATRNIQWKVNIALWTLIAATGSFLFGKYSPNVCVMFIVAVAFGTLHYFFWAIPIQNSLEYDKKLFVMYRDKINSLTEGTYECKADDDKKEATAKKLFWPEYMAAFTMVFLIFVLYILHVTPAKQC